MIKNSMLTVTNLVVSGLAWLGLALITVSMMWLRFPSTETQYGYMFMACSLLPAIAGLMIAVVSMVRHRKVVTRMLVVSWVFAVLTALFFAGPLVAAFLLQGPSRV